MADNMTQNTTQQAASQVTQARVKAVKKAGEVKLVQGTIQVAKAKRALNRPQPRLGSK